MTTTEKLEWIADHSKGGASIEFNEHLANHQTIDEWAEEAKAMGGDGVEPARLAAMEAANRIVRVQFYPLTPIGFHVVFSHAVEPALDEAIEILRSTKEG